MAGERMKFDGFTEISAVCSHPEHRGRGLSSLLVSTLMRQILERSETPFLHVFDDNTSAAALYRKLGFARRRSITVTVLKRRADPLQRSWVSRVALEVPRDQSIHSGNDRLSSATLVPPQISALIEPLYGVVIEHAAEQGADDGPRLGAVPATQKPAPDCALHRSRRRSYRISFARQRIGSQS